MFKDKGLLTRLPREIDCAVARSALAYDPETGCLSWLVRPALRVRVGDAAGAINADGYLTVKLGGRTYAAHRLIFLIVEGGWPPGQVDHRNGVRADNRWTNLRHATHSQNQSNKGATSRNTSGVKGVSWNAKDRRWVAMIKSSGKSHVVGSFVHLDEAAAAYAEAAKLHHGEFASLLRQSD